MQPSHGRISIIIADDHPLVRSGIRLMILSRLPDFDVVAEANNGKEALEMIRAHKPNIALLDISMPEMNGFEVLQAVRKQGIATQVVMLSMYDEPEYALRTQNLGGDGYVTKTSHGDELIQVLEGLLEPPAERKNSIPAPFQVSKDLSDLSTEIKNNSEIVLSKREKEILSYVVDGYSAREIGEFLKISSRTVEVHRQNILRKTGAANSAQLVKFCLGHKLLDA